MNAYVQELETKDKQLSQLKARIKFLDKNLTQQSTKLMQQITEVKQRADVAEAQIEFLEKKLTHQSTKLKQQITEAKQRADVAEAQLDRIVLISTTQRADDEKKHQVVVNKLQKTVTDLEQQLATTTKQATQGKQLVRKLMKRHVKYKQHIYSQRKNTTVKSPAKTSNDSVKLSPSVREVCLQKFSCLIMFSCLLKCLAYLPP